MNKKLIIAGSIYLVLLFVGVFVFLNVSEDEYCIYYEGHIDNKTGLYISGLDKKISKECFNNIYDRNKRLEYFKEIKKSYYKGTNQYLNYIEPINLTHLNQN